MATPTLSTGISRRKILAGGSAAALSAAPLPVLAAGPDSDAELLRRLARAVRRRAAFNAARLERMRLFRAMTGHPDYPPRAADPAADAALEARREALAERVGYRAAVDRRNRAHDAYMAAARAAFAIPPRTLRGLHAKLRFAARASKEADNGNYEHGDNIWLDIAMADLKRLAAA